MSGAHLIVAPVFVWTAAITTLPHKEERFLFGIYPLVGELQVADFILFHAVLLKRRQSSLILVVEVPADAYCRLV